MGISNLNGSFKRETAIKGSLAVLVLLSCAGVSWGRSQTLLVFGHGSEVLLSAEERERYTRAFTLASEGSRKMGHDVIVASTNGSWSLPGTEEILPANNEDEISDAIKAASARLREGDTFVVNISGHGGPPDDELLPGRAWIRLNSPDSSSGHMTFREFGQTLVWLVPKGVTIKLMTDVCFGGGIHQISFNFDHVCSASLGDFRSPTWWGPRRPAYAVGFWEQLVHKKVDVSKETVSNLYEAHTAGFLKDGGLNWGRGSISSFDYVDFVLKEGPYGKQENLNVWQKLGRCFDGMPSSKGMSEPCVICGILNSDISFDRIRSTMAALNEDRHHGLFRLVSEGKLPPQAQNMLDFAGREWERKGPEYLASIQRLKREYAEMGWFGKRDPRQRLKFGDLRRNREAVREFSEKAARQLSGFFPIYDVAQRYDKIRRFMKAATANQKEKFASLLRCEWEPL